MPSTVRAEDRSLIDALCLWGARDPDALLTRFDLRRAERLRRLARSSDPAEIRARLTAIHEAEARADFARIDASWLTRALLEETPAVQRTVAAGLPEALQREVATALGLDPEELVPDEPPDERARRVVMALWSERLVGGEPPSVDDAPVVRFLTETPRPKLQRALARIRLAKLACDPEARASVELNPADAAEMERMREALGAVDERLAHVARLDTASAVEEAEPGWPTLGLLTPARLLTVVEPFRVRWTLQHLPYPVAKAIRGRKWLDNPFVMRGALLVWEASILRVAGSRESSPSIEEGGS